MSYADYIFIYFIHYAFFFFLEDFKKLRPGEACGWVDGWTDRPIGAGICEMH